MSTRQSKGRIRGGGHLRPDAFELDGGPVGILLVHGFTGAPPEMRLLGEAMAERGWRVSAPRLPGHGTHPDDLNNRTWSEWVEEADRAHGELTRDCETVFVGGLSMGALVALELAVRHPEIAGLMAYSPALWVSTRLIHLTPLLGRLVRTWPKPASDLVDPDAEDRGWCYARRPIAASAQLLALQKRVRGGLGRVHQPLLIVQSEGDATIRRDCGPTLRDGVGSEDVELRWLHHSGHNILIDGEWPTVARWTAGFVERLLPEGSP